MDGERQQQRLHHVRDMSCPPSQPRCRECRHARPVALWRERRPQAATAPWRAWSPSARRASRFQRLPPPSERR